METQQTQGLNFNYDDWFNQEQIKVFKENCKATAEQDKKEDLEMWDYGFNENMNNVVVKISVSGVGEF